MMARLTNDQMRQLLAAYEAGEKIDDIATRFGVTRGYVPLLARRKGIPARVLQRHKRRKKRR